MAIAESEPPGDFSRTKTIGAASAIALIGWWFAINPLTHDIATRRLHLANIDAEVGRTQVMASLVPVAEQQAAELAKVRRQRLSQLAERGDADRWLRQVDEAASASGVSLARVAPKAGITTPYYRAWPIEVEMDGTYSSLARFVELVQHVPHLVTVGELGIAPRRSAAVPRTIFASLVITNYVRLEEEPGS